MLQMLASGARVPGAKSALLGLHHQHYDVDELRAYVDELRA
ncbi:MAG: hypothetical protein WAK93_20020 [Solirubrobacteraceae bacterium]